MPKRISSKPRSRNSAKRARLAKLRLLRPKRQAEFRNRFLEIGFQLAKYGNAFRASAALVFQFARSNQLAYEA